MVRKSAGSVVIINNGLNPKSNRQTIEISDYKTVFPALGLYPWDAVQLTDKALDGEIGFIKKQKIDQWEILVSIYCLVELE